MSEPSNLDARDDLRELADYYEQVAALELPLPSAGGGIGARLPLGAQAVLDADEVTRALELVDQTVFHWCMVLLDAEQIDDIPDLTPARARMVGEHTDWLLHHEGPRFALDFIDDLSEILHRTRHLALRGDRKVLTGMRCPHIECRGQLYSPLGTGDRKDNELHCTRCSKTVPFITWSRWPRARIQFITPEHAARLLGTSVNGVRIRAHRGRWRRVGIGRDVRYHVEDVRRAGGTVA